MKKILDNFTLPKLIVIILFLIIGFSIFVRAQGIGYSNFQGDEVNTVDFLYQMSDGVWEYLMDQKRGPLQYVVNLVNVSIFGYHDEFQIRLPYLIFGILAIFFVYKLASKLYNNNVALFAALFMAINGLFIAFARITQYQSLMYMLIPISVMIFVDAIRNENIKKLIISALIISLALLTHYDTMSVMPFFIVALIGYFYRKMKIHRNNYGLIRLFKDDNNRKIFREFLKYSVIFFPLAILPALAYYIPFYLHSSFDSGTSGYLSSRLLGGGLMPKTGITIDLLTMYIPKFHLYTIFFLGLAGLGFYSTKIREISINKIKIPQQFITWLYLLFIALVGLSSIFSLYPIKPRLSSLIVLLSAFAIVFMITFIRKLKWEYAATATWFLGTYSFYFFIVNDPRTHVYVCILPLFLIAGYGVYKIYESIKNKIIKNLVLVVLLLSVLFVSGVNWVVFVDKSPEYPWFDKNFLNQPIYRIERVRYKKIEGVFGFNNYRGWEKMAKLYQDGCLRGTFNSNEKDSITYFYFRNHQLKNDSWEFEAKGDTLFIIEGPHSWEYYDDDGDDLNEYRELLVLEPKGVPVMRVYGHIDVYPDGKLLCN